MAFNDTHTKSGRVTMLRALAWGRCRTALALLSLPLLLALLIFLDAPRYASLRVVRAEEQGGSQAPLLHPDTVCAQCHAAIYASYQRTTMGSGSGAALRALDTGDFTHAPSGVRYRIFPRNGRAWMSFSRPPTAEAAGLAGERELLYFVGSGRHGRTYLYQQAGEWFELPINWYSRRSQLDMAPAYDDVTHMPAPLPVDANCLHCHATEVATPLAEAHNRFARRPFDQGGVGCSSCHGDPSAHLAAGGHAPILNPAKLGVAARDSSCIQCHLEGDAVVYRPGRSLAQFRPGDKLSDFAVYFVRASQAGGGQRASSQYEALLKSACKRASGDQLTCTTCHDPHSQPSPAERVAFFRAKCLQCHTSPTLAATHHPEQPDCATCHMPSRRTADISHEQVTDHDVERLPAHESTGLRRPAEGESLVPVGNVSVTDRELGLAYTQRAQKGDRQAAGHALELLKKAESSGADDVAVHVNLGYLEQIQGDTPAARHEYALALRGDPYNASALVNRAVLDASGGDVAEAVRLLDRLVRADPSQTVAGADLLRLECSAGETSRAATLLQTLRDVNPDAPELLPFARDAQVCPPNAATLRRQ